MHEPPTSTLSLLPHLRIARAAASAARAALLLRSARPRVAPFGGAGAGNGHGRGVRLASTLVVALALLLILLAVRLALDHGVSARRRRRLSVRIVCCGRVVGVVWVAPVQMRWRPFQIVHLRLPYLPPPALLPRRAVRAAVGGVCTGGGAQVIVILDCLEELADEALGAVGEEVAEALLEVLLQLRLTLHLFAQQHHHVVRERRRVRGIAASREQEAAVSRWGRGDGGRREAQGAGVWQRRTAPPADP